jgi:hypothetical protein
VHDCQSTAALIEVNDCQSTNGYSEGNEGENEQHVEPVISVHGSQTTNDSAKAVHIPTPVKVRTWLETINDDQAVIDTDERLNGNQQELNRITGNDTQANEVCQVSNQELEKGETPQPTDDTDKCLPPRKRKRIRPLSSTSSEVDNCEIEKINLPSTSNVNDSSQGLPDIKRVKKRSKPSVLVTAPTPVRYSPRDMYVNANGTTLHQMLKETKDALINASLAHSVAMVST